MAVTLGKRKRTEVVRPVKTVARDSESEDDVRARFQKAFEARFKPLPKDEKKSEDVTAASQEDEDSDMEESEFGGFSEDENAVEVVQHATEQAPDAIDQKSEWKNFMSSKPPSSQPKSTSTTRKPHASDEDNAVESANLKNDLALQRLLKESHLLTPSTFSPTSTGPTTTIANPQGKSRLRALDLRLQDLGAKKSIPDKMPMSHRKGIIAKASGKEEKRRTEAKENGVVLERVQRGGAVGKGGDRGKRRERGIAGPDVGRFRGGTLRLSGRDVREIEGRGRGRGRGGRRGGRGRRA